jgi:hypothetical protein
MEPELNEIFSTPQHRYLRFDLLLKKRPDAVTKTEETTREGKEGRQKLQMNACNLAVFLI